MQRLSTLPEIEAAVWRELIHATRDKQHPWRCPVLATTDGEIGDARTVVLREIDVDERRMRIYTDERAGKVAQLRKHPLGTLVMWSPELGWQLRWRVRLDAQASGLAVSSRWAQIRLSPAAQDYLSPVPPGAELPQPGEAPAGQTMAREFFAVMEAELLSLDWLELHRDGHRRARFDGDGGRWLQP
jgi:pyridoxamine 5'-phosphate oxidase